MTPMKTTETYEENLIMMEIKNGRKEERRKNKIRRKK